MRAWIFMMSLCALLFSQLELVWPDSFAGIQPGVSRKADVERALGAPLKISALKDRAEYAGGNFDAQKIVVHYQLNNFMVERIDVYPIQETVKADYQKWLRFGAPSEIVTDDDGSRGEIYSKRGMMLKFSGSNETEPIEYLSFIPSAVGPVSMRPVQGIQAQSQRIPYLGVSVESHAPQGVRVSKVQPGSPAGRGKLITGDVILEIEGIPITGINKFLATVQKMPTGRPLRFVVQRRGKIYETRIPLEERTMVQLQQERSWFAGEYAKRQQAKEAESREQAENLKGSFMKLIQAIRQEMADFNA